MPRFQFQDYLGYIQRYKITSLQMVPPILSMLVKRPEPANYDLRSLKNVMVGAAPLSVELQNEATRRFGLSFSKGWGMTETTCVGTLLPDSTEDSLGSIGYLLPNTEAKILNEDGEEVRDSTGELYVRGPQVMLRYWNNEKATKENIMKGGWLKTGDIVTVKNHKWWIVDRKKELIKINGLQVAPAEIEAVLQQHQNIADAAVVGIILDGVEKPRAYVVINHQGLIKDGVDQEIKDFVYNKSG